MIKKIEKINKDEVAKLQEISRRTYTETFINTCADKDLYEFLDLAYDQDKLLQEMDNPNSFFYWVKVDDEIAGYLKLNIDEAQSDVFDPVALEVERFYILKQYKRMGLGTDMMHFACQQAKKYHKLFIWLGVWEYNDAALAFYEKQGFYKIGAHPFIVGDDPQTDLIYRKDL